MVAGAGAVGQGFPARGGAGAGAQAPSAGCCRRLPRTRRAEQLRPVVAQHKEAHDTQAVAPRVLKLGGDVAGVALRRPQYVPPVPDRAEGGGGSRWWQLVAVGGSRRGRRPSTTPPPRLHHPEKRHSMQRSSTNLPPARRMKPCRGSAGAGGREFFFRKVRSVAVSALASARPGADRRSLARLQLAARCACACAPAAAPAAPRRPRRRCRPAGRGPGRGGATACWQRLRQTPCSRGSAGSRPGAGREALEWQAQQRPREARGKCRRERGGG